MSIASFTSSIFLPLSFGDCFTDDIRQQFANKYQTAANKIAHSKYSSKTTAEFLAKFNSLDEIQQNSILENEKYI